MVVEMYNKYLWYRGIPTPWVASVYHLPEVRIMTPFGRGKPASQVPKERWLFSNDQTSSFSSSLLISRYLGCLLGSGQLEFSLDPTVSKSFINL